MATAKEIKENVYFEEVYNVLEGFKMKLALLREDLARTYGEESRIFLDHDRHLLEMAEYIDWKIQVLEKGTSFDWKTAKGNKVKVESDVSVLPPGPTGESDVSGGYLGG
jgi:hypothetical protein